MIGPVAASKGVFVRKLLVVVAGLALFMGAGAARTEAAGAHWTVTPSAVYFFGSGIAFRDGSASSPTNMWAVGENDADRTTPVAQRFDGHRWIATAPAQPEFDDALLGVQALSGTNVWAVGWQDSGPLIEHYNGSHWAPVNAPGPAGTTLSDIAAASASDLWAVGDDGAGPVIEHYNGTTWRLVAAPGSGLLRGVLAISATNVWAVGTMGLVEHYDGSRWRVITTPAGVGADFSQLARVPGSAAFWLIGADASSGDSVALYRRDGAWVTRTPLAGGTLFGIAASSASNVWAAGRDPDYTGFVEHWNGSAWSRRPSSPLAGGTITSMTSIPGTGRLWAVGTTTDGQYGPFAASYR